MNGERGRRVAAELDALNAIGDPIPLTCRCGAGLGVKTVKASYSAHRCARYDPVDREQGRRFSRRVAEGEIVEIVGAIVKPACGASRSGPASPSRREKVDLSSGTWRCTELLRRPAWRSLG